MPPRLPSRPFLGQQASFPRILHPPTSPSSRPICLLCSSSPCARAPTARRPPKRASSLSKAPQRRTNSTAAATVATATPAPTEQPAHIPAKTYADPRKALAETLVELQKEAPSYVSLPRLRLALQNLRQEAGHESVRIAVLALGKSGTAEGRGVVGVGASVSAAKTILKVLLADPLSSVAAAWEKELDEHDLSSSPLVVRIGRQEEAERRKLGEVEFDRPKKQAPLLHELQVDSPEWNGHNIELLVMESAGFNGVGENEFMERALVPTVEMMDSAVAAETRCSGLTTPVHRTLIVGEGFEGAATISLFPPHGPNVIPVANIPDYHPDRTKNVATTKFHIVDLPLAERAIDVFRASVSNAMEYERLWYDANMPRVVDSLKHKTATNEDGSAKGTTRDLACSLLDDAQSRVEAECRRRRELVGRQRGGIGQATQVGLESALSEWAEQAHRELQEGLDMAFNGRRWGKLGWWRLLWRVDDVAMIAGDVVTRHFLVDSERGVVYLAGRMREANVFERGNGDGGTATGRKISGYPIPKLFTGEQIHVQQTREGGDGESSSISSLGLSREEYDNDNVNKISSSSSSSYPTNITHTRSYLTLRTVPALQALAQKLVLQTASTAGTTGILGGLMFAADFSIESAVAVALFGAMWSFRRMQRRWETARGFWEGEVREEGRKAIRAVEESVAAVLRGGGTAGEQDDGRNGKKAWEDVDRVEILLRKARGILGQLK